MCPDYFVRYPLLVLHAATFRNHANTEWVQISVSEDYVAQVKFLLLVGLVVTRFPDSEKYMPVHLPMLFEISFASPPWSCWSLCEDYQPSENKPETTLFVLQLVSTPNGHLVEISKSDKHQWQKNQWVHPTKNLDVPLDVDFDGWPWSLILPSESTVLTYSSHRMTYDPDCLVPT